MIETQRLKLRKWIDSDSEPFHKLNNDPKVLEFLPKTLSREESDSLIGKIMSGFEKHEFGLWAVELKESREFVGFVGLSVPSFEASFTPCVEIGWRLASEHWGNGYATEAAKKALDLGFREYKLDQIFSFTVPDNIKSRRIMEKIGLKHNPKDDFDHPKLPPGDPLRRHVLYKLSKQQYLT